MKRICILMLLLSFLLSGCTTATPSGTEGISDITPGTSAPQTTKAPITQPFSGWKTENGNTYYIEEDGSRHTGWLELDGIRYYLGSDGTPQTGWLQQDGKQYYLKTDGSVTRGKAVIDGKTYYFTSKGVQTIVVNPWNTVPSDYKPQLVAVGKKHKVDSSCYPALMQMLNACQAAGYDPAICSSFREPALQVELYNNKVEYFLNKGYGLDQAKTEAGKIVARPGTSEHELGLALDLVDNGHWDLDESQEKTPAQKWLMEHCWEYGFILRYPNGKSEHTGIIYEPWHYRYVGVELSMELKDSGLCLEEYFASLS